MDLTSDDTVCVWVARVQDRRGETEATAWSALDKAQSWVEWTMEDDVEWQESRGESTLEAVFAVADGDSVGEVRCVGVQDPVSLAQRFPEQLPASRFISD